MATVLVTTYTEIQVLYCTVFICLYSFKNDHCSFTFKWIISNLQKGIFFNLHNNTSSHDCENHLWRLYVMGKKWKQSLTFRHWRTSFSFSPLAKKAAPSTGIRLKLMSNSRRVRLCFKAFIMASDPALARPAIWKRNFFKPTFSYKTINKVLY